MVGLKRLALLAAVIGLAMIFKKMGIKWWKAFIPVYGEYVLFKKYGIQKSFFSFFKNMMALYFFPFGMV